MLSIILKLNNAFFYKYASIFLIGSFILLILVLIPGIGKIRNGSRSWFGIGSFGIQPSEFTKIGLIIFISKFLSNSAKDVKSYKKLVIPIITQCFLKNLLKYAILLNCHPYRMMTKVILLFFYGEYIMLCVNNA